MIGAEQLERAIQGLHLQGKAVCIHAGMRSFGDRVEGGAEGLLQAFLRAGCTVMAPAFAYGFLSSPSEPWMPPQNGCGNYEWYRDHPLDPPPYTPDTRDISQEDMGAFARTVLLHPDAHRGDHPLNAFCAVGPRARELMAGQNAEKLYAPFEALCRMEGMVLMLGTDLGSATIIHYSEQLAGRTPFVRWYRDHENCIRPAAVGSCSLGFEQLTPVLAPMEKRAEVGESVWRMFPARDMAHAAADAIRREPMITHCGRPHCKRCHDAVLGGPVLTKDFWRK